MGKFALLQNRFCLLGLQMKFFDFKQAYLATKIDRNILLIKFLLGAIRPVTCKLLLRLY